MAYDMLEEGLIDEDDALLRVDANRLEEFFKRRVDAAGATPIATGLERLTGRSDRHGRVQRRRGAGAGAARASGSSWSAARPRPTTTTA